jgi:hypothetical protein
MKKFLIILTTLGFCSLAANAEDTSMTTTDTSAKESDMMGKNHEMMMKKKHEMMKNLSAEQKKAVKAEIKRHRKEMKKITGNDNSTPYPPQEKMDSKMDSGK